MGGIVAHISRGPTAPRFENGLAILCHNQSFQSRRYVDTGRLRIGAVYPEQDRPASTWLPRMRIGVVVYGHPVVPEPVCSPVDANRAAELYLDEGIDGICGLDGGFVVAILDLRQGRLVVVNDRMATIPVKFWRMNPAWRSLPKPRRFSRCLTAGPN